MADFRIIDRRDSDDGCTGCSGGSINVGGEGCGGCCNQRVIPQPNAESDEELLYKPGQVVKSKLTNEKLMVLKAEPDNPVSYVCRTSKYEMVRMFDFELEVE